MAMHPGGEAHHGRADEAVPLRDGAVFVRRHDAERTRARRVVAGGLEVNGGEGGHAFGSSPVSAA